MPNDGIRRCAERETIPIASNCIAFARALCQDRYMRNVRSLRWAFVVVISAMSGLRALGDDTHFSKPLIQASFNQLIPRSYPTIKPNFSRLQPTTLPLIHPGIPRVHITENLVDPLAQPLLLVNEAPQSLATVTGRRALQRARSNTP